MSLLSFLISLIFINHGANRIIQMTLGNSKEYSVFRYMQAGEIVIIGLFLLLVECKSPRIRANVGVMYRPTPKTILILILSIFLYTSPDGLLDFYLVIGMGTVMLLLSFYTSKPRHHLVEI